MATLKTSLRCPQCGGEFVCYSILDDLVTCENGHQFICSDIAALPEKSA